MCEIVIKGETIELKNGEYRKTKEGKIIITHDKLIELADKFEVYITETKLEYAWQYSKSIFNFVYRSYGMVNGHLESEVGEASPNNCPNSISFAYPAIIADKRSKDRMYIRMLGLKGDCYSDYEVSDIEDFEKSFLEESIEEAHNAIQENQEATKKKFDILDKVTTTEDIVQLSLVPNEELLNEVIKDVTKAKTPRKSSKKTTEKKEVDVDDEKRLKEALATKVTFGKYKTLNKSIQELKEELPNQFDHICSMNVANYKNNKEVLDVIEKAKFIKSKEAK